MELKPKLGRIYILVHAPVGGEMIAADFGINGGWGGIRTTKAFVNKFTDPADKRGRFFTQGQSLEINDLGDFKMGMHFYKIQKCNLYWC